VGGEQGALEPRAALGQVRAQHNDVAQPACADDLAAKITVFHHLAGTRHALTKRRGQCADLEGHNW